MLALNSEQRRELLDHYMAYEPTLKVEGYPYKVHVLEPSDCLLFVALNTRMWWIEGAVFVPREFYEEISTGLSMAWLTMTVYDDLEASVKSGKVRISLQDFAKEFP